MSSTVCVLGLWHLGTVYSACLADLGHTVVGLDFDHARVDALNRGLPPVAEPGLPELLSTGLQSGRLTFTTDPVGALRQADTLWVTFDTPVDDADVADVPWLRGQLERVRPYIPAHALVIISAQVPVGFGAALRRDWTALDRTVSIASAPENLRLGQAIDAFRTQARIVVGTSADADRQRVEDLFGPMRDRIVWMSVESAEMTKHALNAFLAMSVAFINEIARICEQVGADVSEVEEGLRTEPRIGPRAYVTAGGAIAGGTLARDVAYLNELAAQYALEAPLFSGVRESHRVHLTWTQRHLTEALDGVPDPRVALLGLTYKVGTDTLRRSSALELAAWLASTGAAVTAFDPAIHELPPDNNWLRLGLSADEALDGADALVLATPWPEFAGLDSDLILRSMRRPQVIDQGGFLNHLASDPRVRYVRVGRRPGVSSSG